MKVFNSEAKELWRISNAVVIGHYLKGQDIRGVFLETEKFLFKKALEKYSGLKIDEKHSVVVERDTKRFNKIINDNEFCRDCGQIGCGHNVYK